MDFLFEMNAGGNVGVYIQHGGRHISDMEIIVNKEESFFFDPQFPLDTGIDLAGLVEVVADRFDADGEREQIPIFGSAPNCPIFIHHPRLVGLLVVHQDVIVVNCK